MKTPPTLAPVIGTINPTGITESGRAPQMAKMPWYPRDFASATRGWPLVARGAYRELLDAQWDMGALPEDPRELRLIIAATPKEWSACWPFLESKMPVFSDGRRRNPRLEAHRVKAIQIMERQRAGAASTNAGRSGRQ
jgi:uncharacterized protein YdaU (DUF1376 family)